MTARAPVFQTVPLNEPIVRGEQKHHSLTLRKPHGGELRGCSLAQLGNLDVDELMKVLPRISDPILTAADCAAMDPGDLMACAVEVAGFAAEGRIAHRGEPLGLADDVEDVMADLAVVFHWSPAVMDPMPLSELMRWRAHAERRSQPAED